YLRHSQVVPRPYLLNRSCFIAEPDQKYSARRQSPGAYYEGAYSTLTEYLRLVRRPVPKVFERRFETAPGEQAQVDFAEFPVTFLTEPQAPRKVWLFSMVLGHSRWLWGRFCPNQTLETVLRCHIAAFEAMGGSCAEILYDRMKTAVLGEDPTGVITYNPSLVALLDHYGSA
ncbi:DDE-type integrase/transposase/recombinase, partial [Gluconacetobacter sacchari]|uniref:DDE-type integrase/transposase/recombinase n=1 Tax=Gluconacetobacter sacchari TaxID=92759 RepID=UPI001FE8E358